MSEVKKIATRVSYGNALVELAKEHDDVYVLDADLAAATQTAIFKKEFPDRHIDCGIAECNMMGIAAGLAATGKVPFASSFAMFAAGRAFEQVRNSIGYPHLNVKIGATHAGISVAAFVTFMIIVCTHMLVSSVFSCLPINLSLVVFVLPEVRFSCLGSLLLSACYILPD